MQYHQFVWSFQNICKKLNQKRKSPAKRNFIKPKSGVCQTSLSKASRVIYTGHTYVSKETHNMKVKKLTKQMVFVTKCSKKRKTIGNMTELLQTLKQKQLVTNKQHVFLHQIFGALTTCLFKNQQQNTETDSE